jgi:hypothetical protein
MTRDTLPGAVTKKRRLYFTMVRHPLGAKRVGNAYATKQDARDAVPLVRGAWRGLRVVISQCTLVWRDGVLCPKSLQTLDHKYNMDPPKEPPCST